jgi:hypothetical protein
MARFEIAVQVEPARAWPSAGRAGPLRADEEVSWFLW